MTECLRPGRRAVCGVAGCLWVLCPSFLNSETELEHVDVGEEALETATFVGDGARSVEN